LTGHLSEHAKRFQAWQLAALDARPAGAELLSFGPFRALIPAADQPGVWVTIVEGPVDRGETNQAVTRLRSLFKERKTELEIEYNETLCVYLLAWLDDEPAGTGVSHSLKGAAEIVGVVTRADKRRRGIAATVTSELVTRHFAASGDFVFLDAANAEAARVYERLGFERFGGNVVYRGRR